MRFPVPTQLTPQSIKHSFGRMPAKAGEKMALQNKVKLEQCVRLEGQSLEISGQVEDDRRYPYDTQLYYTPDNEWVLQGECSCSARSDCKHCAALAFAWLANEVPPPAPSSQINQWLQSLSMSATPESAPETRQTITYQLAPSSTVPHHLCVQIFAKLAGSKSWSKPKPVSPADLQSMQGMPQADKDIGGLLRSLQDPVMSTHAATSPMTLKGKLGQLALEQLLGQTVFWIERQKLTLSAGGLRPIELKWEHVGSGSRLQTRVDPPADKGLFQVGQGVYYVDTLNGTCGLVDIPVEQWLVMAAAPVISTPRLKSVSQELLRVFPQTPLPPSVNMQEIMVQEEPQAVLTLTGTEQGHQAQLSLKYGAYWVEPSPFVAHKSWVENNTLIRLTRSQAKESEIHQILLNSGLLPLKHPQDAYAFAQFEPGSTHNQDYVRSWHHWLNDTLPQLQQLGWQVDISPSFQMAFISSPTWKAELKTQTDIPHWFDVSLGVDIEGEKVDLFPLILRLLRSVPDVSELKRELAENDTWLMPIDNPKLQQWAAKSVHKKLPQRWLEIPAKRLAWILDLFVEIFDYLDKDPEDDMTLTHWSAMQIQTQVQMNPRDYGVTWSAPPALSRQVESLLHPYGDYEPPEGLNATLRPYQAKGVVWLQTLRALGLSGILADDMGLGKTLQTLAFLLGEKQAGRLDAPALVVVPTSVVENWLIEARRFTPDLQVLRIHGSDRVKDPKIWQNYDLLVTTYALFRHDKALHGQINYSHLILDEAQNIKNPRSRTALSLCAQPAQSRLCISGTPLENSLEELWSLFHFLMPGFLDTLEKFNSRFRRPIEKTGDTRQQEILRDRVSPFMLRRRKVEVEQDLPPKTEIIRSTEFGNRQRDLYETLRLSIDERLTREIKKQGLKRSRILVLDALLKLRQVCCHPQLLDWPEAQKCTQSAKLELLMTLLPALVQEGRRVLVFSQFVKMLEIIEPQLKKRNIPYLKLTGSTRERQPLIESFQTGETPVFLISLKAGGVGLNLTAADAVIHYDPWWNPAVEQQATDRAWRIGQDKPVFVYKLIVAGTLEEKILALQAQKSQLYEQLFESPKNDLELQSLLNLIQSQLEI